MNNIQIDAVVEIRLSDLGIHVEDGNVVNEVETKVYKELDYNKILFYPRSFEEMELIESDVNDIMLLASFEDDIQEESPLDRAMNLQTYYSQNTI